MTDKQKAPSGWMRGGAGLLTAILGHHPAGFDLIQARAEV